MENRSKSLKVFLSTIFLLLIISADVFGKVWTYDVPGGRKYISPDYEVTVTSDGETKNSFVYYSFGLPNYMRFNENGTISKADVSVSHKGPECHSHSIFSFNNSVTVRIRVKPDAKNITLPLTSAKVLPSSYEIPCTIENGNTIVFTLDRPEKVAVIANYDKAWSVYEELGKNHKTVQNWDIDPVAELKNQNYERFQLVSSISEGFSNPIIISALPPETRVPDVNEMNTLMINPGDKFTEDELLKYDAIWFKPGVHDWSDMGYAPFFQTRIKRGQMVYIEGGAYVMARFKKYHDKEAGPTSIVGRGVVSGINHTWIHSFSQASQLIDIDTISGITVTDRAAFSIYNSRFIDNVTLLGAWHGNNDGPDYSDNCIIQNCFFLSHDDNLKINDNTHARHCVIWQSSNAHAIMVKETYRSVPEFANSVVEDIDVICYFQDPTSRIEDWARHGMGAIACVTAVPFTIRNFTFRDIRIESPYLYRVFNIYNLNTNEVNPGWFMPTTEKWHSRIDGMHFENISVNSPLIFYRSNLGSGYDNSVKDLTFKNINVNGTIVDEKNKDEFFDIQEDRIDGLKFRK